jgi:hypothetical protein
MKKGKRNETRKEKKKNETWTQTVQPTYETNAAYIRNQKASAGG